VAAVAGEALRILNAFTVGLLSPRALGILYLITDILLLLTVPCGAVSVR